VIAIPVPILIPSILQTLFVVYLINQMEKNGGAANLHLG
jgi:hypothetical protein